MIRNNSHKYSVSALCKVLQIPRSTYYYEAKQKKDESSLTAKIVDIFKSSHNNYGTRKIKVELKKQGMIVSRRRIGRTIKIIKTEFVQGRIFYSLEELKYKLADYVNWFNNHRIHSSLGYKTPHQYKQEHLKKSCLVFCCQFKYIKNY